MLDNPQHPLEFPDPAKHPEWNGTNRRLILAKWMVSPENPLVPRVFVNRVWQWHFGEGIVRSVDDFGTQGAKPTHPELLDYLTVSFRGAQLGSEVADQADHDVAGLSPELRRSSASISPPIPSDKLLWRKAPLRLEAETIRDSMLKVSGLLNDKMFGKQEPIKRGPDGQWLEDNQGSGAIRRSLYLAQTRTRSVAFLHVFDCPDMTSDNQPERFRAVAADAVAGAAEQSAGDADVQGLRGASAGEEQRQLRCRRQRWHSRRPTTGPPPRKEQEIAKQSIAAEARSEGGSAPVHPGDVRGQRFPVQPLIGDGENSHEKILYHAERRCRKRPSDSARWR